MRRSANVATPFTAPTVSVPANVPPPPGFVPSATVTLVVAVGTVLPAASWTATCTAGGPITVPAVSVRGCTRNASCAGGPMNVAATERAAVMVTTQFPVPVHAPLQPASTHPAAGTTASVTAVPLA